MKKIIATAAAIAVSAISAFAFDVTLGARGNVNFGLGTTVEKRSADSMQSTKNSFNNVGGTWNEGGNIGGGFGVYVNFGLLELGPGSLGLQPEFNMNFNNGYYYKASARVGGSSASLDANITDNTIDIPLLVTYTAGIGSVFSLGGGLGPYLSIPLAYDTYFYMSGTGSPMRISNSNETKCDLNFGMAFDVNAGWQVGPGKIVVDCRYMLDFTPTKFSQRAKGSSAAWSNPSEAFTRRGLSVGVGYQYKF